MENPMDHSLDTAKKSGNLVCNPCFIVHPGPAYKTGPSVLKWEISEEKTH
jgi:hypothetical protein